VETTCFEALRAICFVATLLPLMPHSQWAKLPGNGTAESELNVPALLNFFTGVRVPEGEARET